MAGSGCFGGNSAHSSGRQGGCNPARCGRAARSVRVPRVRGWVRARMPPGPPSCPEELHGGTPPPVHRAAACHSNAEDRPQGPAGWRRAHVHLGQASADQGPHEVIAGILLADAGSSGSVLPFQATGRLAACVPLEPLPAPHGRPGERFMGHLEFQVAGPLVLVHASWAPGAVHRDAVGEGPDTRKPIFGGLRGAVGCRAGLVAQAPAHLARGLLGCPAPGAETAGVQASGAAPPPLRRGIPHAQFGENAKFISPRRGRQRRECCSHRGARGCT
mmetsp:Transcript_96505/g.272886  ORF Transcript_96505/g.272886 Transcript_96505/m.272886 type:complete len:274 (+) Transcript_96505:725-1546(+)